MAWLIGRGANAVSGALFEHLPKTGGKACLDAMRRVGLAVREVDAPGHHIGHARESETRDPRYSWNFKFGAIRRPDRWWLSLWKFATTENSKLCEIPVSLGHPFRPIMAYLRTDRTPDEFVGEIINRAPGFASRMFAAYLADADFVFRADNIGPGLAAGLVASGVRVGADQLDWIRTGIKRVNVSKPKTSHASLSTRVRRMVERYESDGFEMFSGCGVYTTSGEIK
jgi:hypothetical protein